MQARCCSNVHRVKRVRVRSYSGPYFPAFRLNTEKTGFQSVNPEISKSVNKVLLKRFITIRRENSLISENYQRKTRLT